MTTRAYSDSLDRNMSIKFQILDWQQYNEEVIDESKDIQVYDDEEDNATINKLKYKISLFGRTNENKTIHVKIEDYTPFFYIEIPLAWSKTKTMQRTKIMQLISYLKTNVRKSNSALITNGLIDNEYKVETRKKFRGFTNYNDFHFIRLIFDNQKSMKAYERWIQCNPIKNRDLFINDTYLKLYESNLEPFLRCMHIRKLDACGWVKLDKYKEIKDESTFCELNISTSWLDLERLDENIIQKFVIASFDIECMSFSGAFPQAKENDPIIQIGTVFSYYGESEPFKKHIITLGGCEKTQDLEDTEIVACKTEKSVLLNWTKLIQDMDPDIITGYNIFGFDLEYMKDRAEKLNISSRFELLSRIIGERSMFLEKKLESSALGTNFLKYYDMKGRVNIDLMKVAQRDHILDSYSLDFVSASFIKENIKSITYIDNQTKISCKSVYGIKVDQFVNIVYNDGLSDTKLDNKFKVVNIASDSLIVDGLIPNEIFDNGNKVFWCHAKDDISPQTLFKLYKGNDLDRAKIAKYCIQDCVLVIKLLEKLQVLNAKIGMANVCSVPLSYIFMRGQGVKIFSLVAKKCRDKNHLIPMISKPYVKKDFKKDYNHSHKSDKSDKEENVGYDGATVFEPDTGVHYEPIPVLDYASLYPRSMIYRNISHECILTDPKYDNIETYDYHTVTYNNNDGTTTTCRYAKPKDPTSPNYMGIIPEILVSLLDARSSTKKLMEKEEDKFKKNILDGLQLAYKVTANSLYGQIGAPTSPIYYKELAASTTATGREMLEFSRDFIQGAFGDMINLCLKNKQEFYNFCMESYKNIPDKKFILPKQKQYSKEDFINFFYDKIQEVFKDHQNHRVKPKVIYGDSVVPDTPILLKDRDNNIVIKTIDNILNDDNKWEEYNVFKSEDNNLKNKEHQQNINYQVWTDKGWADIKRVIRHKTYKKIYRVLTNNSAVDVTEDHSLLRKTGKQIKPEECIIGTELLHNDNIDLYNYNIKIIEDNSKLSAMTKYMYLLKKNKSPCITYNHNTNTYDIKHNVMRRDCIIDIIDLGYTNDYVYDLETSVGHFHAGVGCMIVKNTDSVFFSPKIHDITTREIMTDKKALEMCIEIGQLAGMAIYKLLPEPEEQVYEKTLWPFIIISKKRYTGNLYETDSNKYYQKSMGIVLKRRDNAKIVKIVVGGIVNKILNERSNQGAIDYTKTELIKILKGEYPIDKFIITKTLKNDYKDRTRIVHAVLADRMGERDAGSKPSSNDRIPYVYVITNGNVKLQGERVEHPKYVIEHKIPLDYLFYITNQIMLPSLQFLELISHNPKKLFDNMINKELNRRKRVMSIMDYVDEDKHNKQEESVSKLKTINADEEEMIKHINEDNNVNNKTKKRLVKKKPVFQIKNNDNDDKLVINL